MMFWGCIVSSALVGAGTGLVIFILLWQTTRVLVQKLIVLCMIGLIIIALIKTLVRDLRDSPFFYVFVVMCTLFIAKTLFFLAIFSGSL
jgi:hypothetical protein